MNKQERKAFFYMIKQLAVNSGAVLYSAVFDAALLAFRPFIAVYVTGLLIDAVYAGEPFEQLCFYALTGAGVVLLLSFAEGFVVKCLNQNMEYMYERQNGPLSKKSMQMDYEYLEDSKVHKMRAAVTGFYPRFGLLGLVLDSVLHFGKVIFTLLAALLLVVPKLADGNNVNRGFVGSPFFSVLFFVLIFVINWVNLKITNHYNDRIQKLFDEKKAPLDTRKSFYLDLYGRAETQKDIRMCEQQERISEDMSRIKRLLGKVKKQTLAMSVNRAICYNFLASFSTLLVYFFSGLYGYLGIISIGSVIVFASSIRKVTDSMMDLSETLGEIKQIGSFAINYVNFMNLNQRKHEGTIPLEKRRDNKFSVEFDHVSFKYPGSDQYVIKDLSLSFVIGEKMAIVGKNGSGKTTFIKLLCRLYDVTEGCIKVNGIDIRKYDYKEYCNLFAVVFQDFTMFDFPLGESLACSEAVEEEKAYDALERAGLTERVRSLPKGLKTYIGKGFDEEGVNFSGGEKQKMAIARAIYKDAPFVIMDEPTAALDPEAECEVFEGFDRMVGKKTAIYISHRLASCRFCEDILVFDKGQLVQRGSHDELEETPGLYRELWNAQAQYYG